MRTRSAKFSLSLNRPNKIKHKDKAIQIDTTHSSVSHANQSPIEKQVESTSNPDKAIQMATNHSTNSSTNHPASKKPVLNPDKAMDTRDLSFNHKKSTPSPQKMVTKTDANCSESPIDNLVHNLDTYCQNKSLLSRQDSNVNTCTSKPKSDQPHPLKKQLIVHTQNPNKQSSSGGSNSKLMTVAQTLL